MAIAAEQILRARAGEERALEDLIRAYQQPIARFVAAQVRDVSAVEDLCQMVFVKMVTSLGRLRSSEGFEPWLYRIARNVCRDFHRRERWRRLLFVPLGDRQDIVAETGANLDPERDVRLQTALQRMDADQRQLLALSTEQPRSYQELANLTRLSVSAVKSKLFRARGRLRQLIGRREDDHEH
jgi:RNA polymerase sigma-70 factor, ECF subfamily